MTKIDLKKTDAAFYSGEKGQWAQLQIAPTQYLVIAGASDPAGADYAEALAALYPLAYGVKFAQKAQGRDFVVPPLSAIWWSDQRDAFTIGNRAMWQWRAMIRMPAFVTLDNLEAAKLSKNPDLANQVSLITVDEGLCLQTLHIGPYADEAPILADLHDRVMPEMGLTFGSPHHEIYLSDPRRTAPEKLRKILRQPVKSL